MKRFSQAACALALASIATAYAGGAVMAAPGIASGFYFGLGGATNDVHLHSAAIMTTDSATATDRTEFAQHALAPIAEAGYWAPLSGQWLWGVQLRYKYINQHDSAALPSISSLGNPDFFQSLQVNQRIDIQHEMLALGYLGTQFDKGFAYLGFGAGILRVGSGVVDGGRNVGTETAPEYLTNVSHTHSFLVGIAGQVGYNYFFKRDWFLSFDYTYVHVSDTLKHTVTAMTGEPPQTAMLSYKVDFDDQQFTASVNKVFAF